MNHNIICIWLTSDGSEASRLKDTLGYALSKDGTGVTMLNGSREFTAAASEGKLKNKKQF